MWAFRQCQLPVLKPRTAIVSIASDALEEADVKRENLHHQHSRKDDTRNSSCCPRFRSQAECYSDHTRGADNQGHSYFSRREGSGDQVTPPQQEKPDLRHQEQPASETGQSDPFRPSRTTQPENHGCPHRCSLNDVAQESMGNKTDDAESGNQYQRTQRNSPPRRSAELTSHSQFLTEPTIVNENTALVQQFRE